MYEHPLRDLARKIEALAKEHEAYSQAQPVVQNCVDHLSAIAATHTFRECIQRQSYTIQDLLPQAEIDHDARCTCGWVGKKSGLMALENGAMGCPWCEQEFKPFP